MSKLFDKTQSSSGGPFTDYDVENQLPWLTDLITSYTTADEMVRKSHVLIFGVKTETNWMKGREPEREDWLTADQQVIKVK